MSKVLSTGFFKGVPFDATITLADEADNARAVTIQLLDFSGRPLHGRATIFAYLSAVSTGLDFGTAEVTTETAIGTDGSLSVEVTGIAYKITSEIDGDIDIVLTDTGTDTHYLVLVMPSGKLVVSDAIAFA